MPKKPRAYYRPKNLEEALQLLSQPDTVPLAGGTTLLAGNVSSAVVDLQDLGLNQMKLAGGRLHIGAMSRLADLAEFLSRYESESTPAGQLQKAIRQAGPNTYRNAATLGGVVAARLADSELLAALLALNAELALHPLAPARLGLADYLATATRPAGLISEIEVEWVAGRGFSERVARTPADYPIVSITAWRPSGGPLRLAATGVDARPVRLVEAEAALADGLSEAAIATAAERASGRCHHPGDFRGDTAYRAEMAAVLARRVLSYFTQM